MAVEQTPSQVSQFLEDERRRLRREAGLEDEFQHFRRPAERPFTRAEREGTTLLFGGLTLRHEKLIHAGLEGHGYRPEIIPTPTKCDFQAGKEFGNNGQCNPTYFTVGALVNFLRDLRDRQGLPTREILDRYVFLTAGACGPCRFGMYEAEYRLALRNSGFDGFRVLIFQQSGGLSQDTLEAGIRFDPAFFLTILNSILVGDLLNEVAYQIRPYEVEAGSTDRIVGQCVDEMADLVRGKANTAIQPGLAARLLAPVAPLDGSDEVARFLDQLFGDEHLQGLRNCARRIDEGIEVDFTRPRPIVKVTGEFWAQTTEGDGNFNMFSFLEEQGAEVLVEPVTTWIHYLLSQAKAKIEDEQGLDEAPDREAPGALTRWRRSLAVRRRRFNLTLAERVLEREYERMRRALGGVAHAQISQRELARLGHPYYNRKSGGGEGHLEVAKTIYYTERSLAHMVVSLKPFGCMPSTQSDGAQAAVMSHYPDLIYLPIETSGEGDVNAHSRVQMALGEAKLKSRDEFRGVVGGSGYAVEAVRRFVAARRDLRRPLQKLPHPPGVVGRAARFVSEVTRRMKRERFAS